MLYAIAFLEGVVTFISPCLLPLLPVYVSYLAGGGGAARGAAAANANVAAGGGVDAGADAGDNADADARLAVRNAFGFIVGFTLVFVTLGAFAGLMGGLLRRYQVVVNLATGAVVVVFGLSYLGVISIPFLNRTFAGRRRAVTGFFSAVAFGVVFSLSWTPCVGVLLGSALMLSSQRGSAAQGIAMLLCFSLGLGVPFIISAALVERLKNATRFIKRHYRVINAVSGVFLVAVGAAMMAGLMDRFLSLLSF